MGTGDWIRPCGSWGSTPRLGTTCPLQRRTVCRSSCLLSSLKHIQSGQHRFLGFGSQAPDVIYFSRSKNKYPISNIIIKLLDTVYGFIFIRKIYNVSYLWFGFNLYYQFFFGFNFLLMCLLRKYKRKSQLILRE